MPDTQLAVQLYTVRDHCKTESDFARTCGRLAQQGWRAVQVSAVGVEDPKVVRRILDDHGLACCATHARPGELLWEDPQKVIDDLQTLGCTYTAIGGFFPSEGEYTEGAWSGWIDRFNTAVPKFDGSGVRIGYHNHSHEFAKLGGQQAVDSETAWDLLTTRLHADAWFEIDTYWVAHAGGCPAAWLRKLAGRVPVIHVKDLAITPQREPYMAEVGVGNLDWPGILDAAKAAGVEWFAVEQDVVYRDPFDSLETSLKNLRAMGLT